MAETTLPLSVHIGSTPLDRLLFNCPARVTCAQLLQSVQQALPQSTLSHLSTFHHDRIPLDAEMSQYVQAHDAVIAHFAGQPQPPPQPKPTAPAAAAVRAEAASSGGNAAGVTSPVRMVVAPSSAFAAPHGMPHPHPPPAHMMPHHMAAYSPSHPPMPPHMPYMMYGPPPPPHPSAYHSMPPAPHMQHPPLPPPHAMYPPLAPPFPPATAAITMVEACQLATQSVKPALERYRTTHVSAVIQHNNNSAQYSPTARDLLASLKRNELVKAGSRKRGFQRVSGFGEAETESEGASDDESMNSASSWSAVGDDEADSDDRRAAHAAQLIASLAQSPGNAHKKSAANVTFEHSGSRLIRSTSPDIPTPAFDSSSVHKSKQLKHASVLVLYQHKSEQLSQSQQQRSPSSESLPSTPASLQPSSSPASPVHSMPLSPAASAASSPATPHAKQGGASLIPTFSPRNLNIPSPSSHATTAHAAHPPPPQPVPTVAMASSVMASAPAVAAADASHFLPSPAVRQRVRPGVPVMRERRRRIRRRTMLVDPLPAHAQPMQQQPLMTFSAAAAIPAMPVSAANQVVAAISYTPNMAGAYAARQRAAEVPAAAAVAAAAAAAAAKDKYAKRTYNGKVRVYHNVPINIRTGRVATYA